MFDLIFWVRLQNGPDETYAYVRTHTNKQALGRMLADEQIGIGMSVFIYGGRNVFELKRKY